MSEVAERLRAALQVKAYSVQSPISSLSGGNQQKAILARWVATKPRVVLADEPTRGVSIGSKIELYRLLRKLAAEGAAVVIVSSEFEELLGLADRIYVMRDGRTVGEVSPDGLDTDDLLQLVLSKPRRQHPQPRPSPEASIVMRIFGQQEIGAAPRQPGRIGQGLANLLRSSGIVGPLILLWIALALATPRFRR